MLSVTMATSKLCTGSWDEMCWVGSVASAEENRCHPPPASPEMPRGASATSRSTWTPTHHPVSNSKVFEERRNLLAKWMDGWTGGQRRAVLQDLVRRCSVEQLRFLSSSVSRRLPLQAADFSCLLPRAICLYVFSFLDPRSLCRCARVSWHWRSMVELDQLWRPKCVRRGWSISSPPPPLEQGVWKRHYMQAVLELQVGRSEDYGSAGTLTHSRPMLKGRAPIRQEPSASITHISRAAPTRERPWRHSDRRPRDTLRFNYLDNPQPGEGARTAQRTPPEAHQRLRKAKSLMFLSSSCRPQPPLRPAPPFPPETQRRPPWASGNPDPPVSKETANGPPRLPRWNAGVRPGPVSEEALRAFQRSHRSAPSTPLFGVRFWTSCAPRTHLEDHGASASGPH
ncbi:F-box only protein 16 isoform 2-T2 [Spinachia spinachia]